MDQEEPAYDEVAEMLTALDPDLARRLVGARAALVSGIPDRARHVSASLRELLKEILLRLAPDDAVRAWPSVGWHLGRRGQLTWRTRIRYLARHVDDGAFSSFVQKDVETHVAFMELFERGVHGRTDAYSDMQLGVLLTRAEYMLRFLLRVGGFDG